MTPRVSLLAVIAATALAFPGTGCVSSSITSDCTGPADCAAGEICEEGVCTAESGGRDTGGTDTGTLSDTGVPDIGDPDTGAPDTGLTDTGETDTGVDNDTGPVDTGGNDTGIVQDTGNDTSTTDTGTPDTAMDTGTPDTSMDTGAPDTTMDTGTPDTSMDTGPPDTGMDTGMPDTGMDTGMPDVCASQGEVCTLDFGVAIRDDGDFYCVQLNGQDTPLCLATCTDPFERSGCSSGSFCLEVTGGTTPANMCVPSECTSWMNSAVECSGATCLEFAPDAAYCFTAGAAAEGSTCTPGSADTNAVCSTGLFCDLPGAGATSGTCRQLCELWGSPSCPAGQACGQLTDEQGMCEPSEDAAPYTVCSGAAGSVCGDRSRCLNFNTTDGEQVLCAPYCRAGSATDCSGVTVGGGSTVCDYNTFIDTNDIGICFPPCSGTADCDETRGQSCEAGVCLRRCTIDSDCMGGDVCFQGICKASG